MKTPLQAADGRYDIENCTPKQTRSIERALQQGRVAAQGALEDIHNGLRSRYGLRAMFKSNENVAKVKQMLQNLVILRPMANVMRDDIKNRVTSSPVFVCLTKGSEVDGLSTEEQKSMDHLYNTCLNNTSYAMALEPTAHIVLCPIFFRFLVAPPPTKSAAIFCPIVPGNKYRGNFDQLFTFQSYFLLHELIHFYLGEANHPPEEEVYDANGLVSLNAAESLKNPRAYEYYITCKSPPISLSCDRDRRLIPSAFSCTARLHQPPDSRVAILLRLILLRLRRQPSSPYVRASVEPLSKFPDASTFTAAFTSELYDFW